MLTRRLRAGASFRGRRALASGLRRWFAVVATCVSCIAPVAGVFAQSPLVESSYTPRDGDVIFHTSSSQQSQAIQDATASVLTHVGLVFRHDGEWQVLEAVQPVRWTRLDEWISRGSDEYLVMRPGVQATTEPAWDERLRDAASQYLGRDYDLTFAWGDERIYCSELVYLAFLHGTQISLVAPETFGDLTLQVASVQALITRRATAGVLPNEPIVTPVALTRSPALVPVFSNYASFPAQWGPLAWFRH